MIKNKKLLKLKKSKKVKVNKTKNISKRRVTKSKRVVKAKVNIKNTSTTLIVPASVPITVPVSAPVVEIEKKQKPSMYFTTDTEAAITKYNKEEDMDKRNIIYNNDIKYAFAKLVENVFNTFKFSYFNVGPLDVQKECLSHLVANMHKYEEGKGKAFSYFSIVAKHYLIFHNNTNYKMFNRQVDISEEAEDNTVRLQVEDKHYKDTENKEFLKLMIAYWDKNMAKIFSKQKDLDIAQAVIEIFRNCDRIDSFNKKALYLYIREISNCRTSHITKIINKMKKYQTEITKSYVENGIV